MKKRRPNDRTIERKEKNQRWRFFLFSSLLFASAKSNEINILSVEVIKKKKKRRVFFSIRFIKTTDLEQENNRQINEKIGFESALWITLKTKIDCSESELTSTSVEVEVERWKWRENFDQSAVFFGYRSIDQQLVVLIFRIEISHVRYKSVQKSRVSKAQKETQRTKSFCW